MNKLVNTFHELMNLRLEILNFTVVQLELIKIRMLFPFPRYRCELIACGNVVVKLV